MSQILGHQEGSHCCTRFVLLPVKIVMQILLVVSSNLVSQIHETVDLLGWGDSRYLPFWGAATNLEICVSWITLPAEMNFDLFYPSNAYRTCFIYFLGRNLGEKYLAYKTLLKFAIL